MRRIVRSLAVSVALVAGAAPAFAFGDCAPMGGGGAGPTAALLLIAVCAGYLVLVFSKGQGRPLDGFGRFLGGLVIVVSLIGLLCVGTSGLRCLHGRMQAGGCPFMRRSVCSVPATSGSGASSSDSASPAPAAR